MPKGKTHEPAAVAGICRRTAELRNLADKKQVDVAVALMIGVPRYKKWEGRSVMPTPYIVPFCMAVRGNPYYLLTGVGRKRLTEEEIKTIESMDAAPISARVEPIRPPDRIPSAAASNGRAASATHKLRRSRS